MIEDERNEALRDIAVHLKYLGVGDAATTMGAIEFLATQTHEGQLAIANALSEVAAAISGISDDFLLKEAISEGAREIADAIEDGCKTIAEALKGNAG